MGSNLICCLGCRKCIHKKCIDVTGRLTEDISCRCSKCVSGGTADDDVDEREGSLEVGSSFVQCFLSCTFLLSYSYRSDKNF